MLESPKHECLKHQNMQKISSSEASVAPSVSTNELGKPDIALIPATPMIHQNTSFNQLFETTSSASSSVEKPKMTEVHRYVMGTFYLFGLKV